MHAKYRAARVGRRVNAFLILSGLVAAVLLLVGCSSVRRAAGATTQLALVTATPTQAGVPGVPTIDMTTASGSDPSAQPTGDWTEAGQVTVTPAAPDAAAASEAAVTPEAEPTADGAAAAGAAQPTQFTGKIENLPGTGDWTGAWQVGGRLVRVAPGTTVDQRYGRVALGEQVTVEGWPQADGSLDAMWVIVHGTTAGQPVAMATPVPQPSTQPTAGNQLVQPAAVATAAPAQQGEDQEEQDENDQNDRQSAQGQKDQNHQGDDEQNEQDNQGNQPNPQNQQNNDAVNARPVEFRDVVQGMPGNGLVGTWQIGGRAVNVNARTRLQKGAESVQPGAIVQVMGWQQPDGSINAAYLMVKKNMNAKGNAGNGGDDQGNGDGKGSGNGKGKGNGNGHNNGNDRGKGNGNGKGKGD